MTLYHYNSTTGLIGSIKTLNKRNIEIPKSPYNSSFYLKDYSKHISLFIEKPDLRKIIDHFSYDGFEETYYPNKRWKPGNFVFEYEVNTEELVNNEFVFQICESAEQTDILYRYIKDNLNFDITDNNFATEVLKILRDSNLLGNSLEALNTATNSYLGKTKELFELLHTRSNFKDIRHMYCPTVPHVLIYPDTEQINVSSIKRIAIFSDNTSSARPYKLWDSVASSFYKVNSTGDLFTLNIKAIEANHKRYIGSILYSTDYFFTSDNYSRFAEKDLEELKTYREKIRASEFKEEDLSINLYKPPSLIAL